MESLSSSKFMTMISVYAPTLDEVHQGDLLLLVGDFNTKVGSNSRLSDDLCGKKMKVIMAWENE